MNDEQLILNALVELPPKSPIMTAVRRLTVAMCEAVQRSGDDGERLIPYIEANVPIFEYFCSEVAAAEARVSRQST